MKKNMVWKVTALTTALLMTATLAGCGASSSTTQIESGAAGAYMSEAKASYEEAAYDMADLYETESAYAEEPMEAAGEEAPAEVKDTSRKLITTMHMSAETDDFDAFNATIERKTAALGGYLESVQTYNGRSYYSDKKQARSADYTIRIPAKNLEAFVSELKEQSNIIDSSRTVEDITLSYVDTQSHKKALQAELDRLLELVTIAETVEDIIALEDRIAVVRYQIESIESRLRTYDNQVDYSTIYLNVSEVVEYTPVEPQSAWQRMRDGFVDSTLDVIDAMKELIIGLVANLPRILFFLVFVVIIVLIVRKVIQVIANPSEKRLMKREAKRIARQQKAMEKAQKQQEAQMRAQQAMQAQTPPQPPQTPPQE